MNRRDLLRVTVLGALGAGTTVTPAPAREFPPDSDASKELERSDWKPLFLDAHQNETLILLSDLILPAGDTPGAKEALVNRFLDLLMSAESAETQRAFIAALAYIDGESMRRYNTAFVYAPRERQLEFLTLLAYPHSLETWGEGQAEFPGHTHFQKLKRWVVGAYYSSPIGLKELGWSGTFPHGVFSGCDHSGNEHSEGPAK
jgi:glucoside 3-dehydrogenase (cytochrome c) hitch-hiker subunit